MSDISQQDDLLVQSRFRNNILWKLMNGKSSAEVARETGVTPSEFGRFLNLKRSPLSNRKRDRSGYVVAAQRIADHFHMLPEDLFPASLYSLELPDIVNREYSSEMLLPLLAAAKEQSLLEDPEAVAQRNQANEMLRKWLHDLLCPRDEAILKMRFGIGGQPEHTQKEVAKHFGLSIARISQIECRAFERFRKRSTQALYTVPDKMMVG